jgi:MoaA/NifB/PqqE/SkfB family radical SAM enzyme
MSEPRRDDLLEREQIANRKKHWVRCTTACNSKCLFCLDADTPRNVYLSEDEVKADLRRGIEELDADKVIISGGEATLHPLFPEFVRYAKEIGYDRVQVVTNGTRLADVAFYRACRDAGLGEITYSLHGHTAALHDDLTQTPGAFQKLMKSMARAIRDPRGPIVNVDICINKENVDVIDKIVEVAISVGCTEFDLLHVIPQANAYDNRERMFYDVKDHMQSLHKVFRLNQHPRFVVWTNRFPVPFLEGMEDLIQDPHKLLDEVNGRRFMVRNYLDTGRKLDCREAERCVHCFIEPFCTSMDRVVAEHREGRVSVWEAGVWDPEHGLEALPVPLPYGVSTVGLRVSEMTDLVGLPMPEGVGVEVLVEVPGPVPDGAVRPLRLVADTAEALDAWVTGPATADVEVLIHLNVETAPWMLANREHLGGRLDTVCVHQPGWERARDAIARDVRDPAAFFGALDLPIRTSGLAACQAPGVVLVDEIVRVSPALYDPDSGRIAIRALARHHVQARYRAKSVRCRDCRVADRCDGLHVNMIRDQGLRLCRPLTDGLWAAEAERQLVARFPTPNDRVEGGRPLEAPPPSLPGFPEPSGPVVDPLAAVAMKLKARREERALARARGEALPPSNPFAPRGGTAEG